VRRSCTPVFNGGEGELRDGVGWVAVVIGVFGSGFAGPRAGVGR
jgi:hypothetical protein